MVEYTKLAGGGVEIQREAKPGSNIAPEGEDIKKGEAVVKAGEALTPGRVGAVAALGFSKIKVYARATCRHLLHGKRGRTTGQATQAGSGLRHKQLHALRGGRGERLRTRRQGACSRRLRRDRSGSKGRLDIRRRGLQRRQQRGRTRPIRRGRRGPGQGSLPRAAGSSRGSRRSSARSAGHPSSGCRATRRAA